MTLLRRSPRGDERTGTLLIGCFVRSTKPRDRERREMILAWPIPDVSFDDWINRWFDAHHRLASTITMLLVPDQGIDTYANTALLTAFLACESLHSTFFDSLAEPAETHQMRSEEILEQAPTQHTAWLRERLSSNTKALPATRRADPSVGKHR
jgi:hypothetical protein